MENAGSVPRDTVSNALSRLEDVLKENQETLSSILGALGTAAAPGNLKQEPTAEPGNAVENIRVIIDTYTWTLRDQKEILHQILDITLGLA